MNLTTANIDLSQIKTPCFLVDEVLIERNLKILDSVQQRTGAKIILALKGFAMWSLAPQIRRYLKGTTASSIDEARLGGEEFGGELHVCAPAYSENDLTQLLSRTDHIVFNSFSQWRRHKAAVNGARRPVSCGLRINPQFSEVATDIYNPCGPCSRFGIPARQFVGESLEGIDGLHFHALCEQDSYALERVLGVVEENFQPYIQQMKWVNFGGGHHITRSDYDVDHLCRLITAFQSRFPNAQIYLEPGEAIALGTGYLVATVMDLLENDANIAILDTSATTHMPDVLEMPYRPVIEGAGEPGKLPYTYRLGGVTCLAGDVIGDYSFPEPLREGTQLIFRDMAHYTMVKTTTFNGVRLPSIYRFNSEIQEYHLVRQFGYDDYKNRLS